MTDRRYLIDIRLSRQEQLRVDAEAARTGRSPDEIVQTLADEAVSRAALTLKLPPTPRHRLPASERLRQRVVERAAAGEDTTQIAVVYGTTPDTVRRLRDGATTKETAQ